MNVNFMAFNSITFVVFLTLVTVFYWLLPRRLRLWLIFLASCTFYGFWRFDFLPIVLFSTITDYVVALRLDKCHHKRRRQAWLVISLVVNFGLLFYFKYTSFFLDNIWFGLRLSGFDSVPPALNIILPLGISFYTFQTVSYTVDVYRGFIKPERDFILYGCYVTFFPQLVAGPILRAKEVIWQLSKRPAFNALDISEGLRRIIYGLFLKVVLADNIAPIIDSGFDMQAKLLGAWDVWTLAFLFGFQIYFDFSAYSHIAIGSARLMGITFNENFNSPYMSCSPREFWQKWHITLSSWIRDYLYLPLCGARVEDHSDGGLSAAAVSSKQNFKKTRALFLTWAIMGLWHGANWTFVAWGFLHACFIFGYRQTSFLRCKFPESLRKYSGWILTLSFVMLSWIPFRAKTLTDAFVMYSKLFDFRAYLRLGLRENTYLITALLLFFMILLYWFRTRAAHYFREKHIIWAMFETAGFTAIITLVIIFLRPINQFIYFQF